MAASLAKRMVAAIEDALVKNIGVTAVSVDGQTINFRDRQQMLEELTFWERRAARESGGRPMFRTVDMSGGFGGSQQ